MRLRTGSAPILAALVLVSCVAPTVHTGTSPSPRQSSSSSSALPSGRPGSVHLTAVGDYGADSRTTAGVLTALSRANQNAHLALGDLSYGEAGQEGAWCDFVTARIRPELPFELLAGNHESDGKNGNIDAFALCMPNRLPGIVGRYGREYYVDLPQQAPLVRVIMVSPALAFDDGVWDYTEGSSHFVWTARAIDGARRVGIPWVVVGMHKPCLSLGRYGCDIGPELLHLLVERRVDLVLSGHEHLYQRTVQLAEGPQCKRVSVNFFTPACVVNRGNSLSAGAGTVFVTAGTGGAPLRQVTAADSEARYFVDSVGAGSEPSAYGYVDIRATATDLHVSFVRSIDGETGDALVVSHRATASSAPASAVRRGRGT